MPKKVTKLKKGIDSAPYFNVLEIMHEKRDVTYRAAAERIDAGVHRIVALENQIMKILSRIVDQPEMDRFLEAFFKHDVVEQYMFAMVLSEETFRKYIDLYTDQIDVEPIQTIEQKTEYGVELLMLSQRTYNALIKHSRIRSIKDLMLTSEDDILNIRQISESKADEIQDKLLMWCLGENIPIDYYAKRQKTKGIIPLKETDHDYAGAVNGNYYSNQPNQRYSSWEAFKTLWAGMHTDEDIEQFDDTYNFVFRYDILEFERDDSDETYFSLELCILLQRKGIYAHVRVDNIVQEDMPEITKWLKGRKEYAMNLWKDIK